MSSSGKYALLFPGQGSQLVGMASGLLSRPALRERYDEASEIVGIDLARLCSDGPQDVLTQTENAQPAIFVTSYCLHELVVAEEEVEVGSVGAAAGHSLGEYTALTVAGAFTFADGVRLVAARGRAMADAGRLTAGSMAALIGPTWEEVGEVCEKRRSDGGSLWPANRNAPGQSVVAGSADDINWIVENARALGIRRAVKLEVSGAFHSPLMAPAAEELSAALSEVEILPPAVPVYSNATARPHGGSDEIRIALDAQLTSPVDWVGCLSEIQADVAPVDWLCFGPGETVAGLLKRTIEGASMQDCAAAPESESLTP